jgi:hypothetical protein
MAGAINEMRWGRARWSPAYSALRGMGAEP